MTHPMHAKMREIQERTDDCQSCIHSKNNQEQPRERLNNQNQDTKLLFWRDQHTSNKPKINLKKKPKRAIQWTVMFTGWWYQQPIKNQD